ncbi:MAG TPA: flagellar biosynthetic protein FliR [Solirubrobacteraceae bacterium]|nr:flagellar biosynthetic protein FliR [Solirubrobacteraceae bacterium]
MTPTLSHLITELGGGQPVTGFFLVLARITPLFVVAPLFSSRMIPTAVRGIIGVAFAIGLTGIAIHGQHIPSDPLPVAGLIVVNLLVGLLLSFAVGAVFYAIQTAGGLADNLSGFSFGATIDPINGNQGGTFSELYGLIGVILFIAIGGDAWVLQGLGRTFELVPLTKAPQIGSMVAGAETAVGSMFVAAVEVAAPVILALLITDVAFGLVSKVVPQMNAFSIAFPVKVGVSILVVSACLPFLGGWMSNQMYSSVSSALNAL